MSIDEAYTCAQCARWEYDDRIANIYGMGAGICRGSGDVKGCDHRACLAFAAKQEVAGAELKEAENEEYIGRS